jgi:hypothetical protein
MNGTLLAKTAHSGTFLRPFAVQNRPNFKENKENGTTAHY